MEASTFNTLRRIVYEQSGIDLSEGKSTMVSARIAKRLRALNLDSELAYVQYLERALDQEIVHLLDVISTNVTAFFRENHHFDVVRKTMEQWLAAGQTRFRFWSAASSTGQEPYSLAMTLLDAAGSRRAHLDIRILATDISTRVLHHAEEGVYSESDVASVPAITRKRYFDEIKAGSAVTYRVKPMLRDMIVFRRMNLSQPPFPMTGPTDAIFCRNVMIYFNNDVRDGLIREFYRMVRPDGYLFIGHAESLTRWDDLFEHGGATTYRPRGKQGGVA